MSGGFSNGNDFRDNYDTELRDREARMRQVDAGAAPAALNQAREPVGAAERLIALQPFLLRHSNLFRLLKFCAGPMLRSLIVATPGEERKRPVWATLPG
jgi:hypothetical protein